MEWLQNHPLATAAAAVFTVAVLYFWKLNLALTTTPPEVLALSPHRWTKQEIRATYERLERAPLRWAAHLPPARPDRRYVVVGGSGGVGGQLILHLLERGQSPESIRNVDFRAPARPDMREGPASRVDFVQADIADAASVEAAFAKPWPTTGNDDAKGSKGLTVFHTAAMIVPHERCEATYDRVARVNVGGTRHVLEAARKAGASVLVATSSASTALRPVGYLSNWFRRWPRHYVQVLDEADFDQPLRPHGEYFGNYARAKATAERLVCGANTSDFRTGVIRPANGIYGTSVGDQLVGLCLRSGDFPSWIPNIVQNLVHASHVSIGHLLFEAALLDNQDDMPGCAGRPFIITDPNPPPTFRDIYDVCETTAKTPCKVQVLPPALMLLIAFAIEFCDMLGRQLPSLFGWLRPQGQIAMLQPATFSVSTHTPATDAAAQKPVAAGGLGYRGVYTTLEGVCQQVLDWNREHAGEGKGESGHNSKGGLGKVETMVKDVQNVATMPNAVGA
ncbi:3-beta hydroxysteroid dehydrogenase isomerase family [Apiospora rasikravindrae]|uniref:3-beta hydroxysteroid dehydrogenase isomerase family n=1 Tax=Apiospora rasikravindrae TaxID=990691 RepID=A0ABR1UBR6_9PEZI